MNCSIHKNRFGKVVEVKTQTGEDSVLFKSLAGLPFIETMEEAATLLASSLLYTPTVSKSPSHTYPETKEPKLFFKTNTGVTESYKTALLNNTDKNVEYGFMGVNGNLIAIGSFSTTTNNDSVIGVINEAIATDLIEEKKVFDGTSYSLKGVGSSKLESKVSAVKAYSLLQAVPNNQYQIMAGGFLSLPQAEVELPETEVDTTPVAEVIKNPITAYNTPQELTQQAEQFELDLKEIREKSIANGTFMLAPNGNNSNLSEKEWLIVRHPNFINWFGDWINSPETASKVVDKNGEPEVVYHGSNTMGFNKFSISEVKDGGFFFSSNDRIAKTYTRENNDISFEVATNKDEALRIAEDKGLTVQIEDEDYYIYSNDGLYAEVSNEEDLILTINNFEQSSPGLAGFFINLRDPMVVDGYGANWDEISGYESSDLSLRLEYNEETDQYDFIEYDESVEQFSTLEDAYQHIEDIYGDYVADRLKDSLEEDQSYGGRGVGEYYYQGDPQTGEEAPPGMTTREWVREATHYNDHDGVIFRDIDDNGPHGTSGTGDVFVVTNPSDIKSLDNIGQFDSNNEDIRFSKANNTSNTITEEQAKLLTDAMSKGQTKVTFHDSKGILNYLKSLGVKVSQSVMNLYHGTPHLFDKFSTDFIGTGEGAQAYGWGLYFSASEGIARDYAKNLSRLTTENKTLEHLLENLLPQLDAGNADFYDWAGTGSIKDKQKFEEYVAYNLRFVEEQLKDLSKDSPYFKNKLSRALSLSTPEEYQAAIAELRTAKIFKDKYKEFVEVLGQEAADRFIELNTYQVTAAENTIKASRRFLNPTERAKAEEVLFDRVRRELTSSRNMYKYILDHMSDFTQNRVLYEVKANITEDSEFIVWDKKPSITMIERFLDYVHDNLTTSEESKKAVYQKKLDFLAGSITLKSGEDFYEGLGRSVMALVGKRGDKNVSLALLGAGIPGIQMPANYRSGRTSDNTKHFNYVIFNENAVEIAKTIQFAKDLKDKGIEPIVKGFVHNNEVHLNTDYMTLDTPIHEFGHLWINEAKTQNPNLYKKGLDLIKKEGQEYLNYAKETQPALTGDELLEEALAQAIGDNGARLIKEKSQGFKNFLREFFDWLADKMGISELVSKEGIETLTLKQFSTAVAIELLKGKPVEKIAHKTSYGNDKISIEVEFLQEQKKEELIRSNQLEVWSDLSKINDFHIIAHGVDNMFTGLMTIKSPNGTYTLEGNGGVYFVTKFGEVWASGSKMKQMYLVNSLNEQLQRNIDEGKGSMTYLLLSSGEPQKLKSNSQGAEGFLHILEALMDGGLISPSDFRQSFIDALNKFQAKSKNKDTLDIPKNVSGKKLKETLNKFFSNPKNHTFALRGNLISQIAQELTSKESFKSNNSSIREFLNLEPGKALSGKDFIPAVASVLVENFLKGKAPYLGYALVEITKPVVPLDSKHKAYPYSIGYEDGSKPKLILIENPESTANNIDAYNFNKKDYITPEEAKVNPYHYQNTNVLGGATGVNKGKVNTNKERKKYFSIGPSYTISKNPKKGEDFKVEGTTITFTQVDKNNITLETIQSPLENRGQEALKQFLQYADQMGAKVSLYVESKDKQTSRERLIQFYKSNGFVQKYENDAFEMVRFPRKVNFSMSSVNNKPVYTKDDIEEVTDAKRYSEAMAFAIEEMKKAPSANNKSLQVDSVSETKAQEILDSGGKIFMSKDNMAGGYVLPNGYMGGLFKNPLTTKNRAALPLQQARIEAGGRFFDSYDLNEDTYLKNGFRPLVRMDFNEEYAPENWEETSLVNRPDNVFFVYDPTYKATKGEGDRINDYTEAFSFVTNYLSLENKSANTQGFFSAAVRGEHAPNREWEPEVEFTEKQKTFKQNYYDKHMGNFDAHIATNIPTFRENQIRVASGLVDMLSKEDGTSLIYDIGGSEGGFVKSITDASNGKIRTINLDANKDMQEVHNSNPVEGSVFINEAFFQGFTDNGVTYNTHIPSEKADVVHESMTFQFISHVREPFIKEVKSKYLKEDGIFLLEEKITPETQEQWEANELVKDEFKLKYYSQQYIDRKKEEVLVGMKANQTPYKTLLSDLKKEFLYVEEYWDSGNFKGVIATNNKNKLNAFLDSVGGKMITKYNEQLYKEIPDSAVNSLIENLVNKGDINLSCGI